MKRLTLVVFLLTGCTPLVMEQRMAEVETEVQAIQSDFRALSATFTPEQNEKYDRVKIVQDDATFQEFYVSLDEPQQAKMKELLDRAHQIAQERQLIIDTVQQDLAMRRKLYIGPRGIWAAAFGAGGVI